MNDAKKMAGFVVLLILGVSFLNRGIFNVGSGPGGASANVGYTGLTTK